MKSQLLEKVSELFLEYGFKSVTMDDIAKNMGISKKTIYKYFKDKDALVTASIDVIHNDICKGIEQVQKGGFNAIQEHFEIRKHINQVFRNIKESPAYQLEKHYPKKYHEFVAKRKNLFIDTIVQNLEKGVREGLYRKEINIEMTSLFHYTLSTAIHSQQKEAKVFWASMLDYQIRAIATEKGLKVLKEQQEKEIN